MLTNESLATCSDAAQTLYWRLRCQAGAGTIKGYLYRPDGRPKGAKEFAFEARRETAWAEKGLVELAEEGLIRQEKDGDDRLVWVVPIVLEDLGEQEGLIEKRRAAGRASAAKRAKQANGSTLVEHALPATSTGVHRVLTAEASLVQPNSTVQYSTVQTVQNSTVEGAAHCHADGGSEEGAKAGEAKGEPGHGAGLERVVGVMDPEFHQHWMDCARAAGLSDADAIEEMNYRTDDARGPWYGVKLHQIGGLLRHAQWVAQRRKPVVGQNGAARPMSQAMQIISLEKEIAVVWEQIQNSVAYIADARDMDTHWYQNRTPQDVAQLKELREKKNRLEKALSDLRNQQ
jgi:hypothetical protein